MNDRRAQWLRFYEAALTSAVMSSLCAHGRYGEAAADAERIADAAMARLDARDFPASKVEALVSAAHDVVLYGAIAGAEHRVSVERMRALDDALADMREQS